MLISLIAYKEVERNLQFLSLKESIKRFGLIEPIVVHNNTCIDGNKRICVYVDLGKKKIKAIEV